MNKDTILILVSVLSTPLLGAVVSNYFARRKTSAETKNLNITGEIQVAQIYKDYALQQQRDKEELRKEFTDKIESMKVEFSNITAIKDNRIKILEDKVDELQKEVEKYRQLSISTIDTAKNSIHESVDIAAEQIKKDINHE